jgi:hypothetical protein
MQSVRIWLIECRSALPLDTAGIINPAHNSPAQAGLHNLTQKTLRPGSGPKVFSSKILRKNKGEGGTHPRPRETAECGILIRLWSQASPRLPAHGLILKI